MTIGFLKSYPLAGAHLMGSYHRVVINSTDGAVKLLNNWRLSFEHFMENGRGRWTSWRLYYMQLHSVWFIKAP